MAYNFLAPERDQLYLLPPPVADWLPEDHLAPPPGAEVDPLRPLRVLEQLLWPEDQIAVPRPRKPTARGGNAEGGSWTMEPRKNMGLLPTEGLSASQLAPYRGTI